jgi:hypothetical protein
MIVRYEVALLHSSKCAVILCCMLITPLLFASWRIFAQPQTGAPPAANNLGVIKGTVVDSDGKPVDDAQVYVAGYNEENRLPSILRNNETTSNTTGEFVLDKVIPSKSVIIHAYKDIDYHVFVFWGFNLPPKLERPEVEVKPGETVTGITVRLIQRGGQLHLLLRDVGSKELIHAVGFQLCREDDPTNCVGGSGSSDFVEPVPVDVGISIKIEAEDGKHKKWEYRDAKTHSRYFRAKSGETTTIDVNLSKNEAVMLPILLFLCSMAQSQQEMKIESVLLTPGKSVGIIEGTVFDPNGKRVEGAFVYAMGYGESSRPLGSRWPPGPSTTTDSEGNFTLDDIVPDSKVRVYASKESDYYEDDSDFGMFKRPKNLRIPEVEVRAGQLVNVTVQLAQKVGRIHLYVRDADTKELVDGIFTQWCRKGEPAKHCDAGGMSGPSDYERLVSLGVAISIKIEAEDGLHEKSEYRNPKTGSRYFRAKSGETETVNVYLRKKKKPNEADTIEHMQLRVMPLASESERKF